MALKTVTNCLLNSSSYPLSTTWCALQIRSKSFSYKNFSKACHPKVKEIPQSFLCQPSPFLQGSDHKRSHNKPWSGITLTFLISLNYDIAYRSGESPPCMHKILSEIKALIGKCVNKEANAFQVFIDNFLQHSS